MEPSRYFVRRTGGLPVEAPIETEASPIFLDEGQPLVVGGTMYVVTPWPNVLYAFDLTREGYPLRWKYRPDVSANALGASCCDSVNRGAVYAEGRIVYNLLDGHTVAVDARTGRELWRRFTTRGRTVIEVLTP